MLVQHFLRRSAERYAEKVALVCDGRRWSYAQLEEMSNRVAHALRAIGVRRGDRVGIWLPNEMEAVVAIFATLKADAIFVPLNPTLKREKLSFILNNCRAAALFCSGRKEAVAARVVEDVPSLKGVIVTGRGEFEGERAPFYRFDALLAAFDPTPPVEENIDIDLASLIYTSGSTGRPKGVMETHHNMIAACTSITTYLENVPEDILINVLPLSFDYGLYQVLMSAQMGATLVLERGFAYPHKVLQRMEEERVTGFPGVPTIFALMLQLDLSRYDLSSLRYLTNTAAALPVEHIRRIREAFPHATLYSMYGLTECKRVAYLPPEELDRRPGSVGKAIPNCEVFIVDEQGNRLGPGEVGELVVRGSNVMQGYWELPEETARTYRPGRYPAERLLYTGDLFKMDEEGFLYFVGRKDEMIKSRGEKVSPREVEDVLYKLPQVAEAAVIGVPDPILGQAIKAFLVLRDGELLSEQEVKRHCAAYLEDFMVPQIVEFRDSLPKTASGKIAKRELS